MNWKIKAKNNHEMAVQIADSFGGNVKDYLKKLNQNLRRKIQQQRRYSEYAAA
jgi:hypothetical protein